MREIQCRWRVILPYPHISLNIVVMKVIHQGFTQVKNAHTKTDWLTKANLCLFIWMAMRFSSKIVQQSYFDLAASFWAALCDDINRISTIFLIYSSVLPKTELFIDLKKSTSKLFPDFLASLLSFVFRLVYSSSQALSSNLIPLWIFVILSRGFDIILNFHNAQRS